MHNFLIFFRSFSASDKDKKDKELDLYEKIHRCERNCDVLSWWKENSVILPALSGIAKAVLCVPAGSVASEQLFSIAGLFDTLKRGSLNVETLGSLTLLKANQSILEELRNLSDEESVADSDEENEEEDSVDSPRSMSSSSDENMSMSSSSEEEEREVDEDQNIDYEIPDIPIDGYNI